MTQNVPFFQLPQPWIPKNYAKTAVRFLLTHAAGGLFLDPGLGKTSIVLATLKLLFKQKLIRKVLVVAPLRVCFSTWPKEILKWADFNHLTHVVLHGPKKDELLEEDVDLYIINPEGLDWLFQTQKTRSPKTGKVSVTFDLRRFKKMGFDVLVVDELTKFKNHQADRYKALKQVLGTFGRRWGLTGSPAANGLEQLFGQVYVLDQGRSLGSYITHFRREFFLPAADGFNYVLQEDGEERIYKRLNPLVLRMSAEDYLDMPQLVPNHIYVDLPSKAQEIYDAVEDDLIAAYDGGLIVAKNSGVALGKCRQLANGAIYKTPDVQALVKLPKSQREWAEIHDQKLEALSDLVEELQGQQILIAYEFGHDLERLRKLLPDAKFVADYPPKKFSKLEDDWNAGLIPQLVAQSSSISHGLNLQDRGYHVAWFAPTWDYEAYDQFIRRIWRQGNNSKRVFVHHILARGTVDEAIMATLGQKKKGQNNLFEALKKLRRSRRK